MFRSIVESLALKTKDSSLACFLFLSISSTCFAQEKTHRTIGVVLPLSGSFSYSGSSIKNSIELAQLDTPGKIIFKFEDDQFEPKNTVSAVRKFIEIDHVDGLIVFGTPTALSVNEIVEKAKVPMVVFSMLDKVVDGKKFVMKHWLTSTAINLRIVEEIHNRSIKTVSLVALSNDAMLKLKDSFLESRPTMALSTAEYLSSETDFKTEAAKIKSLNPDAVYLLVWAPQLRLLAKQIRAVGYRGQLFGTQNFENKDEISGAEGALENAWFIGTDDSNASTYYNLYKDKFNSEPVAGGPNAYDLAKIFLKCGDSPDLNACLHSIKDFQGALGTYGATDKNDFSLKPLLKCIKNGKITSLGC